MGRQCWRKKGLLVRESQEELGGKEREKGRRMNCAWPEMRRCRCEEEHEMERGVG